MLEDGGKVLGDDDFSFLEDLDVEELRTYIRRCETLRDPFRMKPAQTTSVHQSQQCCGKNITLIDYISLGVDMELLADYRDTLPNTMVGDMCCPNYMRKIHKINLRHYISIKIALLLVYLVLTWLEGFSEFVFILQSFSSLFLIFHIYPSLHLHIVKMIIQRFDFFYYVFWVTIFSATDFIYSYKAYSYHYGTITFQKITGLFILTVVIFFDAIPDVYLGIQARGIILVIMTLNCAYYSYIFMNDTTFWENTEMELTYGTKTWLLSDVYTSSYVNLSLMVGKHALSTILYPDKYVLLISPIGRKYAGISKEKYVQDWESRNKKEAQIDMTIHDSASTYSTSDKISMVVESAGDDNSFEHQTCADSFAIQREEFSVLKKEMQSEEFAFGLFTCFCKSVDDLE